MEYDMMQNVGWVSVRTNHDTKEFAVETIRKWWYKMGKLEYKNAKQLLITAESEKERKVSDEEFNNINLIKDDFHGEWNYTIVPNTAMK